MSNYGKIICTYLNYHKFASSLANSTSQELKEEIFDFFFQIINLGF